MDGYNKDCSKCELFSGNYIKTYLLDALVVNLGQKGVWESLMIQVIGRSG